MENNFIRMSGRVVVGGAGITGLSLALSLLQKTNFDVVLVEKEERVGGWMKTIRRGNSYVDTGPRSIRVAGGECTLDLLSQIHLNPITANGSSRNRYIYYSHSDSDPPKLHALPPRISTIFLLPMWKKMLWKQLVQSFSVGMTITEDDSIHQYFAGQFGEEFANQIIRTAMCGIFAGDSHKLSFKDCFPEMFQLLEDTKQPTILRSMIWKMFHQQEKAPRPKEKDELQRIGSYSFPQGIQQLPNTILYYMKETYDGRFEHLSGTQISAINSTSECLTVRLHSDSGKYDLNANHFFCTMPSYETARILKSTGEPNCDTLATALESIHYVDVAVLTLIWDFPISVEHNGFGYLVCPSTSENILGVTFDSQNFPLQGDDGQTRMTVMMGGDPSLGFDVNTCNLDELTEIATKSVQDHLNIKETPTDVVCNLHKHAIPQYYIGHYKTVNLIQQQVPKTFLHKERSRLSLLGNYMGGVSINNCIRNSNILAQRFSTTKERT